MTQQARQAANAALAFVDKARATLAPVISSDGKPDPLKLERGQHAAHGFAWAATYATALDQLAEWAGRIDATEADRLILTIGMGEYLSQMAYGLPMSQGEILRPADLGLTDDDVSAFLTDDVRALIREGTSADTRAALAAHIGKALDGDGTVGTLGLDDTLSMVRDQFRRFADDRVIPHAHGWHLRDELIPIDVVEEMGALGVFGLTIPESWGGAGLGKTAMCVVSEELSRGYIGVGSLGTRSEIAAELIMGGGTEAQKEKYLPAIASGEILPTAVFTEPNVGSDLASLTTRASLTDGGWSIQGNKTWITHAARADVMTLLARTNPDEKGYRGLSMFLVEKPRGTTDDNFPIDGLTGGEIPVLGYRGMKEYDLAFDGLIVPDDALLGGEPGQGFKQLMRTFESARIQTAARAIGVAQSAFEAGLTYALDRQQFAQPIFNFPRVADKLVMAAVEITIARQITWFAARAKDEGKRCDLEAGMAKLLAARIAWATADNAVQIHGGNGFALEFPVSRILCDARILSIFEGAAEIQAQVIARRLLESAN